MFHMLISSWHFIFSGLLNSFSHCNTVNDIWYKWYAVSPASAILFRIPSSEQKYPSNIHLLYADGQLSDSPNSAWPLLIDTDMRSIRQLTHRCPDNVLHDHYGSVSGEIMYVSDEGNCIKTVVAETSGYILNCLIWLEINRLYKWAIICLHFGNRKPVKNTD